MPTVCTYTIRWPERLDCNRARPAYGVGIPTSKLNQQTAIPEYSCDKIALGPFIQSMTMEPYEVLVGILYAYPLSLWAVLFVCSLILHSRTSSWVLEGLKERRVWTIIWILQLFLALCFLASAILSTPGYISSIRSHKEIRLNGGYVITYAAIFLYFAAGLLPSPDGPFHPSAAHCYTWITAATMEGAVLTLSLKFDIVAFGLVQSILASLRIAVLLCMSGIHLYLQIDVTLNWNEASETEALLNTNSEGYGTSNKPSSVSHTAPKREQGGWLDYFIGFRILFPYLWPSDSRKQQLILVVSLILVIGQRVINVLVPYQLEQLIKGMGEGKMPLKETGLYVLYRGLQGQQGVLGSIRAILWIPLSQSLFRRLTTAAFRHVLSLSLEFHLSKRIGEVLSALNKGSSLNTFLDSFAFQLFPMVFDLGVAAAYFLIRLDPFYSVILIAVMWCYIYMTIYMAMWRAKARREMAQKDREMDAAKMDTMMSYETVHHNGAVPVETDRFGDHVDAYQKAEFRVLFSLNLLNITQNLVLTLGIFLVILISALQISVGLQTVAMFVSILGYFTQLQAPLQFFGSFYSQVQNNLVDAERMLDLFKEKPTIVDSKNAKDLPNCSGRITFSNVSFAYDKRKPAIEDVTFTAEHGTSTAIVGESGSGKSTCLKLLFRFYDVSSGSIQIDGSDIRDVKLEDLRSHMGIVPQDTILFNTTILYNLQYAKPEATLEEVYDACRAASIHERILSFPEGYQTKVGERGLRLSGGEKQRIAIARAILKNPQIILLDEATASLDSHTEKQIQGALDRVTEGRTTITIAHRLSTITGCDQILVLHEGKLVEKGTHDELLRLRGRYFSMWEKQTRSTETTERKYEGTAV
ncbi:uncharacterized protein EI97DRAFT_432879 [Westerdykella ornata]|uniref:Heavy metal tolerance protein n=1 Tax=Westerdykella ornata TaxID=318751 RepID=A0A6A6JJG9_WESOR|nr:uncharacterized protein EI97DRAFT_432879 [Westerdykella ornata]KAF2276637.1 hypothetical protein EI97DRAFT_432879 [Westerdykella ornata]